MNTYEVELYGTITRDIKHVEVEADDEDSVRAACAREMPAYRVHSLRLIDGNSDLWARVRLCSGSRANQHERGRKDQNEQTYLVS